MKKTYRILIVEDELRILLGIKNTLQSLIEIDSDIMTAENGKIALRIIEENLPDIIITDIRMPEVDGITLIKTVRGKGYNMSIIVLTAIEDFKCIQQLIKYGIQNYIVKPFSVEDIKNEVNKAIEKISDESGIEKLKKLASTHPDLVEKINKTTENDLINKALPYIEKNISSHISLSDVAEYLHVSEPYLSTLFKREESKNFSEYVNDKRIFYSKKLLIETDMNVCEIADEVGYQSDKYFIHVFKKYTGITPQKFRKEWNLK